MDHNQLDKIADLTNPLVIVALVILAFATLKNSAWLFLLRNVLAVGVIQQISKFVQKHGSYGPRFPSTHFAVTLALCVALVTLNKRLWPVAIAYLVLYGGLMLFQHYHTPVEMLAACYAVPIALLFNWKPRRSATDAAVFSHN